jgi:radical SAM family RiPP maturation amino acid epimerase
MTVLMSVHAGSRRNGEQSVLFRARNSASPEEEVSCPRVDGINRFDPCAPEVAHVKRFFEVWTADSKFREALTVDPRQAVASRGLVVDPMDMRYLWDAGYREDLAAAGSTLDSFLLEAPEATRHFLAWIQRSHEHRDSMRAESRPVDPRFAAWRDRQIARSSTIFRRTYDLYTPHILFAIELSKGCSVGCWFCGVSAPKLGAQFLHTLPNRRLLVDVLSSLEKYTVPAAGSRGFLYWATDPLDNPDFEKFCLDFEQVFGRFPIVTTAQPQRDVERTRGLLELAISRGAEKIRFSTSTLRQLDRVHREFSAEELGWVDIIAINQGSILRPSASGRARERYLKKGGEHLEWAQAVADTSISCVSGFLINMVDQTVKLTTPCPSSDRWPLGYYLYDERTFTSGSDLDRIVEEMIARHMPLEAPADDVLRFRTDLAYRGTDDGFVLDGRYGTSSMTDNPLLRDVGDAIAEGSQTPMQIARCFAESYGLGEALPLGWIAQLFNLGLIDEEPRVNATS